MVGENRLGNVVLQMPTEKELLTQRSLRSESGAGGDFGLWILDFGLAEGARNRRVESEKVELLKGNRDAHKSSGLAFGLSISYYDFFHPVSCICNG